MPGLRGKPAVITTTSLPAVAEKSPEAVEMPAAWASVRVMGADSSMSTALPEGGPSRLSVSTTSASSRSTMRCAVVGPTNPPPTTVTFFRLILLLLETGCFRWVQSAGDRLPLHVLDDRGGKCGCAHFCGAGHQPFQVVGYSLLLNRSRDAVLDQLCRFLPAQELEHHRSGEHHGTWIDHVPIGVLRRGSMRGFEDAKAVANV